MTIARGWVAGSARRLQVIGRGSDGRCHRPAPAGDPRASQRTREAQLNEVGARVRPLDAGVGEVLQAKRQLMGVLVAEAVADRDVIGWRLASWFTEPNAWMEGRVPVEALEHDLASVCAAARADRYVATG
jgi:hypothetical protein